jgi:hypothetical protein
VKSRTQDRAEWYRIDLHTHTPASADYQQPEISYLDILQRAEMRGIDIIAFTDHNTVAGYAALRREVDQLEFLVSRGRATPDEQRLLGEYQRVMSKVLVLPGFEFTATFGFHILGIFPPDTPVRKLEHLLLGLRVPYEAIERGLTEVGASADVLTAYRMIRNEGGLVIAAHVNAAHGVAMFKIDFGGQTRIAYTQDPYLSALEVTDLSKRGRYATSHFFDGSKPEYPRRMHCIQGSDAHRLDSQIDRTGKVINFGVGERPTEVRLIERSFEGLRALFDANEFNAIRPYAPPPMAEDPLARIRAQGAGQTQAFHETPTQAGVLRMNLLNDICAFANSDGGVIYLGLSDDARRMPTGVENADMVIEQVSRAAAAMIVPPAQLAIDKIESQNRTIVRVQVAHGGNRPYALDSNRIYLRSGNETRLATRDEIIQMVIEGRAGVSSAVPSSRGDDRRRERDARPARDTRSERTPSPEPEERRGRPQREERHPVDALLEAAPPPNAPPAPPPREERPVRPEPREERQPRPRREERHPVDALMEAAPPPDERQERPPRQERAERTERRDYERPARPTREERPPREERPSATASDGGYTPDMQPRIGVELVDVSQRAGMNVYTLRDLVTNGLQKNVTRVVKSKSLQYPIKQHESNPVDLERVRWNGVFGLWRKYRRLLDVRYDLVLRTPEVTRYFYGVPESELKGGWTVFARLEAQSEDAALVAPGISEISAVEPLPETVEAVVVADESVVVEAVGDTPAAEAPKKKKRRRGGRNRRRGGSGAAGSAEATADAAPVVEIEAAPVVVEAPPTSGAKPKASKPTSPAKRKPAAKAAQAPAPVVEAPPVVETPKPAKKSGGTRKKVETPAAPPPAPEPPKADAPKVRSRRAKKEEAPAPPAEEAKPVRTRRRRGPR